MIRGMTPRVPVRQTLSAVLVLFAASIVADAQPRARKQAAVYQGPDSSVQADRTQPPSRMLALERPASLSLGGLTAAERATIGAVGMAQRIGVHRAISDGTLDKGTWSALADGRRVYRMEIRSDGATGLRVQFSNFSVGAGKVWVHSAATVDGPYTARGPF